MISKVKSGIKNSPDRMISLSAGLLLITLAFAVSMGLLIILIRQVFYRKDDDIFDLEVFRYLASTYSERNTVIMECFTFLGSHYFLVPAFLLFFAYIYFIRKDKWFFIKITSISVFNLLLMFGLKYFFTRSRPLIPLLKVVPGYSFPSGHAFMSLSFFGLIIYFVSREVANRWLKWSIIILLGMIIILVGLSRVYLRLHFASDVIAGYCFGWISMLFLMWILKRIERFCKR